jgi:hypothetical protein
MAQNREDYLVGIEAEMSLAHEAAGQLLARQQSHQHVLQAILEHLGVEDMRVERWAEALVSNDVAAIAEQTRLIRQAIHRLPPSERK